MADSRDVITKMEWWEIPVPDLDEAKRFYGEVMGWGFTPFGEGYTDPAGRRVGFSTASPA